MVSTSKVHQSSFMAGSSTYNSAAKEISQYCYLYYKFQLDQANSALSEGTQGPQKTVEDTVAGLGQMMDSFGNAGSDFEEGNFDRAVNSLMNGTDAANRTLGVSYVRNGQ